jgi:hypothetical protein
VGVADRVTQVVVPQITIQKRMLCWLPRFLDDFSEQISMQFLDCHVLRNKFFIGEAFFIFAVKSGLR